jgi:D-alanine-D-alanine ligase/UDP-N-acetylmuramate--alanine ligase
MTYHFIGIGGIGMSALAQILLDRKMGVSGTDLRRGKRLLSLEGSGARIGEAEESAQVVVSTAIPDSSPELKKVRSRGQTVLHRSELLAHLAQGYQTLAVTGAHGKTTTSSLLAWVLHHAGLDPAFALGGVLEGLSNGRHGDGPFFVLEADESDGTFLRFHPHGAIVTNVEAEHLDHFGSLERLEDDYQTFASQVSGPFFWCGDGEWRCSKGISYGLSEHNDLRAVEITDHDFAIEFEGKRFENISIPLIGEHNICNALAVFGLCLRLGVTPDQIRAGLASFPGVHRRCQKLIEKAGVLVIDDYAHHPTEIEATLKSLRKAFGERRLIAIWEPHRYTRTRDNWERWGPALSHADIAVVTEMYTAGEEPIEGIDRDTLCSSFGLTKEMPELRPHDVVVFMGAGDSSAMAHECARTLQPRPWRVALLCGGDSPERDVSLVSAKTIAEALSPELYEAQPIEVNGPLRGLDDQEIIFPIFHGPNGEDGLYMAYAEATGKPFVGCDFRSASICMDKVVTKCILEQHGILTAPWVDFWHWQEWSLDDLAHLPGPWFVKAAHLGSGHGVERITNFDDLPAAIERVLSVDTRVLIEQGIGGREFEVGVMGNSTIETSPPGEVLKGDEFFSKDRRYGPDAIARDPSPRFEREEELRSLTAHIYRLLGCKGMARLDFFFHEDRFYLNEVNPIPGFTPTSLATKLWERAGYPLPKFLDRQIILGLRGDGPL